MLSISIIVPVYKVEKYLPECIESVLAQTYQDWELLLIDDGSPDACPAICDEYAGAIYDCNEPHCSNASLRDSLSVATGLKPSSLRIVDFQRSSGGIAGATSSGQAQDENMPRQNPNGDHRVKVFHKENGGVSSARNLGLDVCKGDYVTFLDADDRLPENALELSINLAVKSDVDVVDGSSVTIDRNGNTINILKHSEDVCIVDSQKQQMDMLAYKVPCCLWGKLYKRTIIGNVRFSNLRTAEDLLFVTDVLNTQCKVARTPFMTYHYRIVSESLSHNKDMHKRLAENVEFCEELCSRLSCDIKLAKSYAANLRTQVLWRISQKGWFPVVDDIDLKHLVLSNQILGINSQYTLYTGIRLRLYAFMKNFKYNLKTKVKHILQK